MGLTREQKEQILALRQIKRGTRHMGARRIAKELGIDYSLINKFIYRWDKKTEEEKELCLNRKEYRHDTDRRKYNKPFQKKWYAEAKSAGYFSKKYRENLEENRKKARKIYRYRYDNNIGDIKGRMRRNSEKRQRLFITMHTTNEWNELKDYYNNVCLCCGTKDRLTRDHVIPISLGGTDHIDNIQPLCHSCNSSKHTKSTDYRPRFEKMRYGIYARTEL